MQSDVWDVWDVMVKLLIHQRELCTEQYGTPFGETVNQSFLGQAKPP